MPTRRVFSLLRRGSGTPQGLVKVHGFLFARTTNVQGGKGLGVTAGHACVLFECILRCLKSMLQLKDAEKGYFILQM